MAALTIYEPAENVNSAPMEPAAVTDPTITEDASIEEIQPDDYEPIADEDIIDDQVLEHFKSCNFNFEHRAATSRYVTYEVTAKDSIEDPQAEAEALSKAIAGIWNRPSLIIRVVVLNSQDNEMVDFIAENGTTTYNRRKEK